MNTAKVFELVQQPSAKDKALAEMRGLFCLAAMGRPAAGHACQPGLAP